MPMWHIRGKYNAEQYEIQLENT